MTLMQWDNSLNLGVPGMDAEHRELVSAMNAIHDLGERKAAKAAIDAAIVRLAELTTQHFADEERYMARIGFPDLRNHTLIHGHMLEKFTELHRAFRAGTGTVDKGFYDFLKLWLKSHICGIDAKYAKFQRLVKT